MGTSVRTTGLETAAAALRFWERRQEVLANNLANVNTEGFKGERAFAHLLGDGRTPVIDTATDLTNGPMTATGAPLDLAVAGQGFFVVQTPGGERLTRGGALHLDAAGQLTDQSGHALLGEDDANGGTRGPVIVPAHAVSIRIDQGGAVVADGHQVARLRLETVPPGARLQHEAAGLFALAAPGTAMDVAQRNIRQGVREESNVGAIASLVDMIAVQRAYASVQKVLTTIDSARGIAVSELGKPA
ncbi:MAG: flagellar hook-basal body protein [Gemmatimonadaceae bacterium]